MKVSNYIKAKEYFLKRVSELTDVETAHDDIEKAMNDASNIYAESFEEYNKIYDMLNNLSYVLIREDF